MLYQGVGLGLYITSEIIKKHNGKFTINSEPGEGSNFYFRLQMSNIELENVPTN
ncbi:ATP-binding protein [Mucilaginibacter sp. 10I4]|uniref:ATP-binding protein n=1 Tax=unclassified Mucilaginibacter TaxID=2617802 RepID=UPI0034DD481A